ncbi:STAS domain-containing protein [Paenarthrobacter sp. DKR-5]|uniref:STAS domain-containing protein n=1 Tax=Paenarthrobacter sp. DKR-5 TaxID=2835535 RepID=UPI001BDCF94F|nr:STAS domain-containing protein [Paenarthrobacter sp. DKR-5]MBT1004435.1 STAS domain-containing protein [Paenarthrobacter sp. DKR-5]
MIEFVIDKLSDGIGVIRPVGRLNMVSAPQLNSAVAGLIDEGTVRLVVDLSGTDFIDSSGLGALISGLKKTRQSGGDLRLASPTAQITAVLELTSLNKVLRPASSVAEAY